MKRDHLKQGRWNAVVVGVLVVAGTLAAAGCGLFTAPPRTNVATPAKALIGHWQIKDAGTTIADEDGFYFDGTTVYYREGTGDTSKANQYQNTYRAIDSSLEPFSLTIEYLYQDFVTGRQMTARKSITFNSDKTQFTFQNNTDTRQSKEELGPYTYVGPETKP